MDNAQTLQTTNSRMVSGTKNLTTKNPPFSASGSSSSCSLKRKRPPKIEIPDVLREITIDASKHHLLTPPRDCREDNAVCYSGHGVGLYSVKGKKLSMEDAHKIESCPDGDKGFFGVFDGHGGSKAAQFAAENLHTNINDMLEKLSESATKEEAVKAGYLKTDQDFLKQGVGSGACCVTALIEGKELVISNVGDCGAVLCRDGAAEAITKDHRASREDERKRIENKGGYVEMHRGSWRVHGILSVSRSIGDAHLKDWVLADPDTKILHLTSEMEYLVLASDGLWEEVGNQEAIDIVKRSCLIEKKIGTNVGTENVKIEDFCCISPSPSPKLHRGPFLVEKKLTADEDAEHVNYNESDCRSTSPSPKLYSRSCLGEKKLVAAEDTENVNNNEFGCMSTSHAPKLHMQSHLLEKKLGTSAESENENNDEFGCISMSPSPKLRRISLVKQKKRMGHSPGYRKRINCWKENVDNFGSENESPPAKAQRISLVNQRKMKPQTPNQENNIDKERATARGLVAACKELVNLALSRGSLDDITVMIIDLGHFKD